VSKLWGVSQLWALKLEYDGTGFSGWQWQGVDTLTIQQVLEQAASKLVGGEPCPSIVAGRTDAGVHATGQVAQVRLPEGWNPIRVREALNYHMKPHPVVVIQAAAVDDEWNARFSARARHYRYVILNRRARPALDEHRVWHIPAPLDAGLMREAGQHLLGKHDFSSFRASSCQANGPIRTLDKLDVRREGERIIVETSARSFLHHQVRNMVGTLRWFGEGRHAPAHMAHILAAASRKVAGATAPPDGLALTGVSYDPDPFENGP
jgi:tRNA pseudouridine38-40 synthase